MCFLLTVNSCCESVKVCYFIKLFRIRGKSLENLLKSEGSDNDSNTQLHVIVSFFIQDHCNTRLVTAFNYSSITDLHALRITTAHPKSFHSAVSSPVVL
jgi:hypothetical protein